MLNLDPFLSPDGTRWIDPSDGRSVPVVRGGSDDAPAEPAEAPVEAPAAQEPAPAPAGEPAAEPGTQAPEHSFESVEDAVAALKETRAEAARRRTENKELSSKVEKFDSKLAGYKPEEIDYLLDVFHDLSDPAAQKKAAKALAEIADRVLGAEDDGVPRRPTGEEDPDEKPLTKKEWERLENERQQERETQQALKQLEQEATERGYPPDTEGYTVLLQAMLDPEVAGDLDKAVAKVEAYEQSIVEKYRKSIEENNGKWAPIDSASAPAAPGEGPKPVGSWSDIRKAVSEHLKAKAGQT